MNRSMIKIFLLFIYLLLFPPQVKKKEKKEIATRTKNLIHSWK